MFYVCPFSALSFCFCNSSSEFSCFYWHRRAFCFPAVVNVTWLMEKMMDSFLLTHCIWIFISLGTCYSGSHEFQTKSLFLHEIYLKCHIFFPICNAKCLLWKLIFHLWVFSFSAGRLDGSGNWFSALGRINTRCIGSDFQQPYSPGYTNSDPKGLPILEQGSDGALLLARDRHWGME